jgi:16S rRNA (cytosine967-C5)-methyltransferase
LRYIRTHILHIISHYKAAIPLAPFLKNYFKQHPRLGSRDRKLLSEMAYNFYRFAKGFEEEIALEKKLEASLFLSENNFPSQEKFLPAEWLPKPTSLPEKIQQLSSFHIPFSIEKTSSVTTPLSQGISLLEWKTSLLQQPRLFIRVRQNHAQIQATLLAHPISFEQLNKDCWSLPNAAAIDKLLPSKDYVVQDASSQATANYLLPKPHERWWDVCSGAGGKSLLLKDLEPTVQLTVSDVRESILHNLSERFRLYAHQQPQKHLADIANLHSLPESFLNQTFDNIICDVPCTGSGTWARTPEQAYFFDEQNVVSFSEKQKRIATNAASFLSSNARLIYITCSVFQEENECVVTHVAKEKNLEIESMQLINGTHHKADCMFVAVLRKR